MMDEYSSANEQKGIPTSWEELSGHLNSTVCLDPDSRGGEGGLRASEVIDLMRRLSLNRFARSIIWMFCRCVPEPSYNDQEHEVRKATFSSEFLAATTLYSYDAIFEQLYADFIENPMRTSFFGRPEWYKFAQDVIHRFCYSRVFGGRLIFPKVQRRKNVSKETAYNYLLASPMSTLRREEVTTAKLEAHYERTGEHIQGPCEIRSAWKFGDLKPRYYYSQGGTAYQHSRFMKEITVALMNSIPACSTSRRRHFEREIFVTDDDEGLVYWDYSNFTSNLSDLRHFLFYLISGCRLVRPDAELRLFDSHEGEVVVSPWDLIDNYNGTINNGAEFTIFRIIEAGLVDEDSDDLYFMENSGPLGVAGNIGCSTACHATVATAEVGDPDKVVCVGDDALGITREIANVVHTMKMLAPIAPSKFGIRYPDELYETFKFIKRGISCDSQGAFHVDALYDLPLWPNVVNSFGTRTVYPETHRRLNRVITFIHGVSALLWFVHGLNSREPIEVTDEDMHGLSVYLGYAYDILKLPHVGAMPGFMIDNDGLPAVVYYALPPVPKYHEASKSRNYDPRLIDWAEYLYDNSPSQFFQVAAQFPIDVPIERPSLGSTFTTSESKIWGYLEDFGYVAKKKVFEIHRTWGEENRRVFLRRVHGLFDVDFAACIEVTVLKEIPEKFRFVFEVAVPVRPEDSRATSVFA